jgi:hypothetical protein
MSGKRFKALIVAVLLAIAMTISSLPPTTPSVVLADGVCESSASGCP